jgi:hypothetical protein
MNKQILLGLLGLFGIVFLLYFFSAKEETKLYLAQKKVEKIRRKIASLPKINPVGVKKTLNNRKELRQKLKATLPQEYFKESITVNKRWLISKTHGGEFNPKGDKVFRNISLIKLPPPKGKKVSPLVLDKRSNQVGIFTGEVVVRSSRPPDTSLLKNNIKLLKSYPQINTFIFYLAESIPESLEQIKGLFKSKIDMELDVKFTQLSVR